MLIAIAFISRGGSQLEGTTWTEVGVLLIGAAVCAAALALPRAARAPERIRGAIALSAFAALAVFTALSITWSLTPHDSWLEASRTFAYLAAFAAGLALGRLAPSHWKSLLAGIAVATVALSVWSLATKVFPALLAPNEDFARLRLPSDYWNSVGLSAALGVPPLLWLAVRRSGHAAINTLAWPALGLVFVCLLLAYSRGALLTLAITLALWIAIVPLRLRAAVTLGGVLVATAPVVVWAFAQEGLTTDGATMAARKSAGLSLGALLLLLVVALTVAGLAVGFLSSLRPPSQRTRMRASRVLVGAILAVPAVAILLLANAPGGVGGQVSKAWHQATDPAVSGPSNSPDRLTETSSNRARYWSEAMKIHAQAPWLGSGAGAFDTLRLRYRVDSRTVRHAHGYVVQTLADLGWVGLGLSLLATFAWLVAVARVAGLQRRDRGLPWDAERIGIVTLAAVPLLFGLHSTIDWTWFVPANAVPALLCAGWVASRATLRERMEPAERVPGRPSPLGAAAGALVLVIALVIAWSALQPVRSAHAQNAAEDAAAAGQLPRAASIAAIAHQRDPLDVNPLFLLASIQRRMNATKQANETLQQAVQLEPANPETWRRLGQFRLTVLNDKQGALRAYEAAYFLDPRSPESQSDIVTTSRSIAQGG